MKKAIIIFVFMVIGLMAFGQTAKTYNEVKIHCDRINKECKGLGNYIWGIIQYYNPQMTTNLVTREPVTNKKRIGLCQIHEFIVQANFGKYNANDLFGSIMMAKDFLLWLTGKGVSAQKSLFYLLYGLDITENPEEEKKVYNNWLEQDFPKIDNLADEFTGWGF